MSGRGEHEWGEDGAPALRRSGVIASALAAFARALERESDRWFLWLPVLFAGGILAYFSLSAEPEPRVAIALVLAAVGICVALRDAPLGLAVGGALLAFAFGFAAAKLRTEMARAPVLAEELRYVTVTGLIEDHTLRDKGRARITLRVISLDGLEPEALPHRVRVTMPGREGAGVKTGDAVRLKATLQPPPEPIEPGGADFGRQAWFAGIGGTGYAMSKIERLEASRPLPWDLRLWASIDALRGKINARIKAALPGGTRRDLRASQPGDA
jgi:competence protein ComEC